MYPLQLSFVFLLSFVGSVYTKSIKALVTILSVCNAPPAFTPYDAISTAYSVKSLTNVCTYGNVIFDSVVMPYYVNIPCPASIFTCSTDTLSWALQADDAIRQNIKNVRVDDFKYRIYILPNGCNFAGLGVVGPCKNTTCRIWINGGVARYPSVYFHEIMHNLGLNHAGYNGDPTGDMSDSMSYCCENKCLNAPHSNLMGYTQPLLQLSIPLLSSYEINLEPNAYIKISDQASQTHWFVQNRQSVGLENIPYGFANSVNIYTMLFNTNGGTTFHARLADMNSIVYTNVFSVKLLQWQSGMWVKIQIFG